MRKSTKSVLQTSMFLSSFSHRGSLSAQGIGKGGMRACVPILPKRAFFSSFTSPLNAILCQAFGQCRGGKKVGEQQKRQPHMLPCPQPLKVERSVYIPFACRLYPSHGPLRFITSHSFRARLCHAKNEAPEEEAAVTTFARTKER